MLSLLRMLTCMRQIRENVTEAVQSKNYLIEKVITADTSFVSNRVVRTPLSIQKKYIIKILCIL